MMESVERELTVNDSILIARALQNYIMSGLDGLVDIKNVDQLNEDQKNSIKQVIELYDYFKEKTKLFKNFDC